MSKSRLDTILTRNAVLNLARKIGRVGTSIQSLASSVKSTDDPTISQAIIIAGDRIAQAIESLRGEPVDPTAVLIENDKIVGAEWWPAVDYGGLLATGEPRYIVLHYTGGTSFDSAVQTLTAEDGSAVSTHVIVGTDGRTGQCIPFNTIAYHAGESSWNGETGLNKYSIGIEMVNPGYAREGITYDAPTIHAAHENGGPEQDWYLYPDVQIDRVVKICAALTRTYPTIVEYLGHDEIAPDRKTDPGPAWDWDTFNERLAQEL